MVYDLIFGFSRILGVAVLYSLLPRICAKRASPSLRARLRCSLVHDTVLTTKHSARLTHKTRQFHEEVPQPKMKDQDAIAAPSFRLLDLPLELRLMIYEFFPVAHTDRNVNSTLTLKVIWLPTTILRTCQSIKNESIAICRAITKRYDEKMQTSDDYKVLLYFPRMVVHIDRYSFADVSGCLDVVPELLDFALTRNSEKLPPPQVTSYCKNTLYVLEWAGQANRFLDKVPRDDLSRVDLAIEVDASTMEDLDLYRDQCSHGLWEMFIRKMKAFSERDDLLHTLRYHTGLKNTALLSCR
jgi:hypothetical protein